MVEYFLLKNAAMAQLVERVLGKDEVTSSTLVSSSKNPARKRGIFPYSLFTIHSSLFTKPFPFVPSHAGFLEVKSKSEEAEGRRESKGATEPAPARPQAIKSRKSCAKARDFSLFSLFSSLFAAFFSFPVFREKEPKNRKKSLFPLYRGANPWYTDNAESRMNGGYDEGSFGSDRRSF